MLLFCHHRSSGEPNGLVHSCDFDQMLNQTDRRPIQTRHQLSCVHTGRLKPGSRPPTNSSLPDKTMEDEPEEVTFNVDRLHSVTLNSESHQIHLQLSTPIWLLRWISVWIRRKSLRFQLWRRSILDLHRMTRRSWHHATTLRVHVLITLIGIHQMKP